MNTESVRQRSNEVFKIGDYEETTKGEVEKYQNKKHKCRGKEERGHP